ncbi:hypothetical protein MOQ72_29380 [Saccharopolyspora sp. K220]|uniref:hypothetical protein n=1 Tax=Saccharopolyspora soli TaxID=2926618 RepID=UPI001F55B92F|nr:hypothetical protein [Saccharopolyspora soli]MCI2421555.1 hypothetical protein [Saccharopolyspora soli]
MANDQITIMVKGVPQQDEHRWEDQRSLIQESGARYDRDARAWYLELDAADSERLAASLMCLFKSAQKFGTKVLVLDPHTGMPAMPSS